MRVWLRRMVRKKRFVRIAADTRLVAVGDSHCRFWSGNDSVTEADRIPGIITCHVGPGLAWTLIEDAARTRSGRSVKRILRDLAAQAYGGWVLLCFGEIDLRAHVLKHAAELGLRASIERLIDRYLAFVVEARRIHPRIALWGPGASLPAGTPDNPDFPAIGSETERNEATVMFTALLEDRARRIGVPFLSLLPLLIDERGGTRRELLYDGCHISQSLMPEARRLVADALDHGTARVAKAR
jgi:hypothetical protein